MKILAIESSCDETAAAIVENGTKIISNTVASSTQMHQKYGGIVPEIAARKQLEFMIPVLEKTLGIYSSNNKKILFSTTNCELRLPTRALLRQMQAGTMNSFDAIAVAVGPGLIGSLLVGVETAKTLAMITGKPIVPVNHVLAHMYANFISSQLSNKICQTENNCSSSKAKSQHQILSNKQFSKFSSQSDRNRTSNNNIVFPAISLVVSGGHTELYLMKSEKDIKWLGGTIDDAAGECFDKGARILGFGSGGGLAIQNSALEFVKHQKKTHPNPPLFQRGGQEGLINKKFSLPRPMLYDKTLNFSFSGLKTALMREVNKYLYHNSNIYSRQSLEKGNPDPRFRGDDSFVKYLSYELQEAITDVLVSKTLKAVKQFNAKSILISGGVAANLRLREKFKLAIINCKLSIDLFAPQINLCTDNAVYIAAYAYFHYRPVDWRKITAIPDLSVEI